MQRIVLDVSTALVFLILDALMLRNVMRPLVKRFIGDLPADRS